jgi:hypothetical protein
VLAGPTYAVAANALLDMLGMVLMCRVEKTRAMFQHPGHAEVTVVIDHVAGIGAFAETEVMAPDPAAGATLLGEVEQQLGLTGYPVVNLSYRDLVLQHDKAQSDCPSRRNGGQLPGRHRAERWRVRGAPGSDRSGGRRARHVTSPSDRTGLRPAVLAHCRATRARRRTWPGAGNSVDWSTSS